jgi:hypothetical protein
LHLLRLGEFLPSTRHQETEDMTAWYQPLYDQAPAPPMQLELRTAEGEPIYLGPYTKEQAPYLECSNCGQPITVGQELLPDMTTRILGVTYRGQLVYVTPPSQEGVAPVHADCTAEYAHDQITKEACARDEEAVPCGVCGVPTLNDDGLCSKHGDQLSGDAE